MRRKAKGLVGLLLILIPIIILIPFVNIDIPLSIKNSYPISKCYTYNSSEGINSTCVVEYYEASSIIIIPLSLVFIIITIIAILIGIVRIAT